MKEYLFGCIILSLISAVLTETVPSSLEPGVKSAVGVGLVVFATIPLGSMISSILTNPVPDIPSLDGSESSFYETSESAYKEGVALLLADKYSCQKSDFAVTVDGFNAESLSAECIHITLSGDAVLLDYRALSEYVTESLKVVKCDVQIEFS